MCCNDKAEKVDLRNQKFENINLNINKSNLQFFPYENYGIFRLTSAISNDNSPELNDLNKQLSEIKKDIDVKGKRIELLKNKIEEIDQKIDAMNQILNIDVSEKEYITELGSKLENQNKNLEINNDF